MFAQPIRKLAHFGEFMVLGILAYVNAKEYVRRDEWSGASLFAVLYAVSAVLGLIAVLIAGPGTGIRIVCIVIAFAISLTVWFFVFRRGRQLHPEHLEDSTMGRDVPVDKNTERQKTLE